MPTTQHIIVFITTKDVVEARKISKALLENKLIACANILDGVQSLFWWQGKIDEASEAMMILKTKKILFKKVLAQVKALHSYQTPEVIALPMIDGNSEYLKWINESVKI